MSRLSQLRTVHGLMQERAKQGELSYIRQLYEMAFLKFRHGIGINYYQAAGFWRKEIAWEEKAAHLGAADFVARLQILNPEPYRKLTQNKLAEKAMLTVLGIPTPKFLAFYHPIGGRTTMGEPLTNLPEFDRFLNALPCSRICFKLVEGMGGTGFIAVDIVREPSGIKVAPIFKDVRYTVAEFYSKFVSAEQDGRIIEEYLEQHAIPKSLNETSVNTLRVWAFEPSGQRGSVIGTYIRIGRKGSLVDNHLAGGIVAPVNHNTGVVGCALDGNPARRSFATHPETGAQIEGVQLPFWSEVLDLSAAALAVFPRMRLAGFDVAISTTGPVIIETNNFPDLDGAAYMNLKMAPFVVP